MDSPAVKRRKTASPNRPYASFMSPTKASLSRFNPSLLPSRAKSTTSSPSRGALFSDNARTKTFDLSRVNLESDPNTTQDLTETIETPSRRNRVEEVAEEDDLPQTPEKLLQDPNFKDTPPRGILFSSREKSRRERRSLQENPTSDISKDMPNESTFDAEPEFTEVEETTVIEDTSLDFETIKLIEEKQQELAKLKEEIRLINKSVKNVEKHLEATTSASPLHAHEHVQELISIALSTDPSPTETSPDRPSNITNLLNSFLPFAIPTSNATTTAHFDPTTVASHTPHTPTPALLALFTPFSLITSLAPPLLDMSAGTVSQTHSITLTAPHQLLTASLIMKITSSPADSPMIDELKISHLSPWAASEIGSWAHEIAKDGDISCLGYALGRYWEVSTARSKAWDRVWKTYPALLKSDTTITTTNGTTNTSSDNAPDYDSGEISLANLAKHLGRRDIRVKDEYAELRIGWTVEIDWAGDAVSKLYARASFPRTWHEADERKSLRNVPKLFERLIQKHGASNAMIVLIGSIFKDGMRE